MQTRKRRVISSLCAAGALILSGGIAIAQPANNLCANAQLVTVGPLSSTNVAGTTVAATVDGTSGNCGSSNATPDVWYRLVAPAAGVLTASTCGGATFDSVVSFRSACPGSGALLACNDDACGNQSTVSMTVAAGITYWIRVSGFNGATGAFTLTVTHAPPPSPPAPNLGPDVIVSNLPDILRHGTSTDGTI